MINPFMILQLKLREQRALTEAAEFALVDQKMNFLPHRNFPVAVHRDGDKWVCSFGFHPDPLLHVMAYGDCPAQACSNFDALWNGVGVALEDEEEDEEEY